MITASLSEDFLGGENDTLFLTDFPFLSEEERERIANFVEEVGSGKSVIGKNKPSYWDDDGSKIRGTDLYESYDYWHYHCGKSWLDHTFKCYTVGLKFNPSGKASKECIHYYKISEECIKIVGYSRSHIPFLLSDVSNNPFFVDIQE